jgi:hypothetical protein
LAAVAEKPAFLVQQEAAERSVVVVWQRAQNGVTAVVEELGLIASRRDLFLAHYQEADG